MAVTHDTRSGERTVWLSVANQFRCCQFLSTQFRLAIEPFTHDLKRGVTIELERFH
jgi:hypothetical protein